MATEGPGEPFLDIKRATGISLACFIGFTVALATVGIAVLSAFPSLEVVAWPQGAGALLIAGAGAAARLLIVVGGLILWLGQLKPKDIGLRWARVPTGLGVSAVVWVLAQLIGGALGLLENGTLVLHPDWGEKGPAALLGHLGSQFFAVALIEEVSFRGYLLPQLTLYLRGLWPGRPRLALLAGLVLSQGLFALLHLPFFVHVGVPLGALPAAIPFVFFFGVFFSGIYLRTGNLFFPMGVHALVTAPAPLFTSSAIPGFVIVVMSLGALAVWPTRSSAPGLRRPLPPG